MSLPRIPKAVIFDMDGLLVDTESVYREAMTATAIAGGLDFPNELFLRLIGLSWPANAAILQTHFGAGFDPEAFKVASVTRFRELVAAEVALKAGVIEILDLLDDMALPRAIATSSGRESVNHHIGGHGLLERFHALHDHRRIHPAGHADHRRQDAVAPGRVRLAGEEFHVDLEDVHRNVLERVEGGIPAAEIVHQDFKPVGTERAHGAEQLFRVVGVRAFGNFQFQ